MTEHLPTSPDNTDWGIYGESAREQWEGVHFEAEMEDLQWDERHDSSRCPVCGDFIKPCSRRGL